MLKASVIGNIGAAPDLRYSASGSAVLRFNVASNGRVRTPEGEWRDETTWVRVAVFGQRAESLSERLTKGTKVYVSGRLEARPWTDQQGNVRSGLEITASDVEFAGPSRPAEDGHGRPLGAAIPAEGSDDDLPF